MTGTKTQNQPSKDRLRTFVFEGEEYYIPTRQGYAIADTVSKLWDKLGRPDTPFSRAGEKIMEVLIATWQDTYPNHYREWVNERRDIINSQMTPMQQVLRSTGRNLAAYPMYMYKMMRFVFPRFSLSKRENHIKLVKKWPIFSMVEKRDV